MLKPGLFQWTYAAFNAFEALKQAMVLAPILALLDFSAPFVVECDTSMCRL